MTVRRLVLVSVGVLAIAGCGDDDSDPPAAASGPAATAQAPAATTPATPTGPAAGKSTRKPVAPGGTNDGPTKNYSGDGSKSLALDLKRNAVLRWTVSGSAFASATRAAGSRSAAARADRASPRRASTRGHA